MSTLSAGGHCSETIAAISTPSGEAAIALLRLSCACQRRKAGNLFSK